MKYDYLVVGSGLYGAVFAHEAKKKGKTCLVIDKRPHIGGNIYCENIEGIEYVTTNQNEALKEKNKIKGAINRYIQFKGKKRIKKNIKKVR